MIVLIHFLQKLLQLKCCRMQRSRTVSLENKVTKIIASRILLESRTIESNSLVYESDNSLFVVFLSTTIYVKVRRKLSNPLDKAKYFL